MVNALGPPGPVEKKGRPVATRLVFLAPAATGQTRGAAFARADSALARTPDPVDIRMVGCRRGPELRCAQTAAGLGWTATVEDSLADLDVGDWAGADPMDLLARDPAAIGNFFRSTTVRPPGGETVSELIERVGGFCGQDWPDGRTVLITSAPVIRAAAVALLGLPGSAFFGFDVEPLSALVLTGAGSSWKLQALMPFAAWTATWNRSGRG